MIIAAYANSSFSIIKANENNYKNEIRASLPLYALAREEDNMGGHVFPSPDSENPA